jgi:hypothetical protein
MSNEKLNSECPVPVEKYFATAEPPCDDSLCCANCPHFEQYHTSGVIPGTTRGCLNCDCKGFEPAIPLSEISPIANPAKGEHRNTQPVPVVVVESKDEAILHLRSLLALSDAEVVRLQSENAALMRARICAEETHPQKEQPVIQVRPVTAEAAAKGLREIFDGLQTNFHDQWEHIDAEFYLQVLEAELTHQGDALSRARKCAEETAKTPITREDILGADDGSELLVALRECLALFGDTPEEQDAYAAQCVTSGDAKFIRNARAAIAKAEANPSQLRNLALIAFDERRGLLQILGTE